MRPQADSRAAACAALRTRSVAMGCGARLHNVRYRIAVLGGCAEHKYYNARYAQRLIARRASHRANKNTTAARKRLVMCATPGTRGARLDARPQAEERRAMRRRSAD